MCSGRRGTGAGYRVLPFSPVTIIPRTLHLLIHCHRHQIISSRDSIFKKKYNIPRHYMVVISYPSKVLSVPNGYSTVIKQMNESRGGPAMNETGLGQDSFRPLIVNFCAEEQRSEDELQTTDDEMIPAKGALCLVRCGGLLATERGENAGLILVKAKRPTTTRRKHKAFRVACSKCVHPANSFRTSTN